MALDQSNIPLTGDLLDDLVMAFRELFTKVRLKKRISILIVIVIIIDY